MKTILLLIGIVFLMIGCCSSKVYTQYITSGVILIPNYVPLVKSSNFCCIDTLIQTPEPGTYITPEHINPISIMWYDCYGKTKVIEFNMTINGLQENK